MPKSLARLGALMLILSVPGIIYFGFDFIFVRQYGFRGSLGLWLIFWAMAATGVGLNRGIPVVVEA